MGVLELQMEDRFSEKAVDLYEGDIIDRVNGVKFSNAAEVFQSVFVYLILYKPSKLGHGLSECKVDVFGCLGDKIFC